jgi:hypothetical protein
MEAKFQLEGDNLIVTYSLDFINASIHFREWEDADFFKVDQLLKMDLGRNSLAFRNRITAENYRLPLLEVDLLTQIVWEFDFQLRARTVGRCRWRFNGRNQPSSTLGVS